MEAALRSAIRACYAGHDSVTLRREVASRMAPPLGVDAYAFSLCDPETELLTHTVASGVPAALNATFVRRLYPEEFAIASAAMRRTGHVVFSSIEQSPMTREEFAAHGIHDHTYVGLAVEGKTWGAWCMMRGGDATPRVRTKTASLLRKLAPHAARGLRAAARIDAARAPSARQDARVGVLVLDARHRRTTQTPAASEILHDLADHGLDTLERLPMVLLSALARLDAMRAELAPTVELRARGRSGQWYHVEASRSEPDASGQTSTVIVLRAMSVGASPGILLDAYQLSPREREVVAAVVRGEATKTIAASLGISPYTVTEHLDRACGKIGVRGRKALVAKLFAGYAASRGAG